MPILGSTLVTKLFPTNLVVLREAVILGAGCPASAHLHPASNCAYVSSPRSGMIRSRVRDHDVRFVSIGTEQRRHGGVSCVMAAYLVRRLGSTSASAN